MGKIKVVPKPKFGEGVGGENTGLKNLPLTRNRNLKVTIGIVPTAGQASEGKGEAVVIDTFSTCSSDEQRYFDDNFYETYNNYFCHSDECRKAGCDPDHPSCQPHAVREEGENYGAPSVQDHPDVQINTA